jgi:hypothetical protein
MESDLLKAIRDIVERSQNKSEAHHYFFDVSWDSFYEADKNTAVNTVNFDTPIDLSDGNYGIGVVGIDTWYSFPNVTSSLNGNFRYSTDNKSTWNVVTIPTGNYEITTIAASLADQGLPTSITVKPDKPTLRARIKLGGGCAVDFTYPNSINKLLGFNPRIVDIVGNNMGDNIVDILSVNTVKVNVDCIRGSYSNGKVSTAIFGFFPNVSPGEKIIIFREAPIMLPFTKTNLSSITVWLTDQDGNLINFRENITVRFVLKRF